MTEHDPELKNAVESGLATLASIKEMVLHYDLAELKESDEEITPEQLKEAGLKSEDDIPTRDDALQTILDRPLSTEIKSRWYSPGADRKTIEYDYRLLMGWGGPAVQITGELDEWMQPTSAKLEVQDWYTPWVPVEQGITEEDEKVLLRFAQHHYFEDNV